MKKFIYSLCIIFGFVWVMDQPVAAQGSRALSFSCPFEGEVITHSRDPQSNIERYNLEIKIMSHTPQLLGEVCPTCMSADMSKDVCGFLEGATIQDAWWDAGYQNRDEKGFEIDPQKVLVAGAKISGSMDTADHGVHKVQVSAYPSLVQGKACVRAGGTVTMITECDQTMSEWCVISEQEQCYADQVETGHCPSGSYSASLGGFVGTPRVLCDFGQ